MMAAETTPRLARALTVDQAYSHAYADTRRLLRAHLGAMTEEPARLIMAKSLLAIEARLESELGALLYSPELARMLARPV